MVQLEILIIVLMNLPQKKLGTDSRSRITTFSDSIDIIPEIQMIHTSGHSNGHCIILLKQGEDT